MKKILEINLRGITPLAMHSGRGADPTDRRPLPEFLKNRLNMPNFRTIREATASLSGKRGKSQEDHEKLAELGFYSSLDLNDKNKVVVKKECFEAALLAQSKELKKGQQVKRGVLVIEDALLDFPGKDDPIENFYPKYAFTRMVKVSMSKTPRTRAMFEKWSCSFKIEYVPKIIDFSTLKDVLELGEFYGMLEMRPRHGRYKIESLKHIS